MGKRIKDFAINILTSGKQVSAAADVGGVDDKLIEHALLNFISIFGALVLLFFAILNFRIAVYADAFACTVMAVVAIAVVVAARTRIPEIYPASVLMLFFGTLCIFLVQGGSANGTKIVYAFIYPMLTMVLLGRAQGIIYSVVLLVVIVIFMLVPGLSGFNYRFDLVIRMAAVYLLVTGIAAVFETSRKSNERANKKLTGKLEDINSNLQHIVMERTQKISQLQDAILKTMASLVESRDLATGKHTERTQCGVKLMLDEMAHQNLFTEITQCWDLHIVLQSVQLHDIGKIAISDLILNKPAKLTKEEFDEIKKHVTYGATIIDQIQTYSGENELLSHARVFALTHHEKWNGSGYPAGLSGESIPLQGRIVAIVDVYDALVSVRPYKEALSHEEALQIIIDEKAKHFDPRLVDIFVAISDQLKKRS